MSRARRGRTLRVAAAPGVALALLAARPARAGDALHGKRLYLDAARVVGSEVSCVDCHGGLPGGLYGIGRAAGDPALVATAVDSVPQMAPFRGRLAGPDFADLAAYIATPGVASPQLALATRRPDGAPGPSDRIEFGSVAVGAASDPALLEIVNTGQLAFAITGPPELAGPGAAEFTLASADCAAGAVVAPGAACRFALVFHPAGAAGPRTARFGVPHDWIYGVAAVAMLGSAAPAGPPVPAAPPPAGCSAAAGPGSWVALGWLALRARPSRRRAGYRSHPAGS